MRRNIPRLNIIICGACLLLLLADRFLGRIYLFNEKPAKIVALVACLSTFLTCVLRIARNRKNARRRRKRREA
ncbi:MAG: hypothetical protein E7337_00510 [Clostridiales bacterium]|nr:hypothetical protein [Clostridiales bacterium]